MHPAAIKKTPTSRTYEKLANRSYGRQGKCGQRKVQDAGYGVFRAVRLSSFMVSQI